MKKQKNILLFIIMIGSSGCSSKYHYTPATDNPLPYKHAKAECNRETAGVGLLYIKEQYAACMYRRGWNVEWDE